MPPKKWTPGTICELCHVDHDKIPVCAKCNRKHLTPVGHESCPGHINGKERTDCGSPCKQPKGYKVKDGASLGFGPCWVHGGAMKTVQKATARKKLDYEVQKVLDNEAAFLELGDWVPVTDPFTMLSEIAGKALLLQQRLEERVQELETIRQEGGEFGEQTDIVFAALERALDRCARIGVSMGKLDLTARIAQLQSAIDAEAASTISKALESALSTVELEPGDRDKIMRTFGAKLREHQPAELPPSGSLVQE